MTYICRTSMFLSSKVMPAIVTKIGDNPNEYIPKKFNNNSDLTINKSINYAEKK
ncbi:hypothetical protein Syun_023380 [Stephania yunnanensis]|uniref:Uncharacterized protein n=1 Tax=Stephania yunnanensis TaxID=152371 RepID=A0AAP0I3S1_9MAGN